MPELPEVETVARGLAYLAGKRIERLEIVDPKVWFESEIGPEALAGQKLLEASRRGKYLLLRFSGGITLVEHLRMTGKMLDSASSVVPGEVRSALAAKPKGKAFQVRARFHFEGTEVWFFDTRRFGTLGLIQDEEAFFAKKKIAPDPFHDPERAFEWFAERLARSEKAVKASLLDQSIAAGVGNIYADEALHAAGIHPLMKASQIREPRRLWNELVRLMSTAIEMGGSTVRDYVSADGEKGEFVKLLRVYDRKGELCQGCGGKVERIVVAGRSTHFCIRCQPKSRARARRQPEAR